MANNFTSEKLRRARRSGDLFVLSLLVVVALFWGLRIHYWQITDEEPFSDMQGLQGTAENIQHNFDFSWSPPFYRAYVTPVMPGARALQMALTGPEKIDWSYAQTLVLFLGLLFLALETYKWTKSRWLALALILVVTLSQSSIFWSLKVARESLAEASVYWFAATLLWALRRDRAWCFLIVGIVSAIALLNRNNFLLVLPSAGILILLTGIRLNRATWTQRRISKNIACAFLFTLGAAVVWSPWIIRNYKLSGELVPLGTQTPYSFFWEYGDVEVKLPDGSLRRFHSSTLNQEAYELYPNDFVAYRELNKLVALWIEQNRWYWVRRIMLNNIPRGITDSTIYLTKVPRENIYQSPLSWLLVDKQTFLMLGGIIGLLMTSFGSRLPMVFAITSLVPWLNGAMINSYPRMMEPSIPAILFGNIFLVYFIGKIMREKKMLSRVKAISQERTASEIIQIMLHQTIELVNRFRILRFPITLWGSRFCSPTNDRALALLLHKIGFMGRSTKLFIDANVSDGMTVVDIGANQGIFSLYMSKKVGPSGKVHSVEPDKNLCDSFENTLQLNSIENVTLHPCALGSEADELSLNRGLFNSGDNRIGPSGASTSTKAAPVTVLPFDELLPNVQPDFIKIDVQGWELEVFKGMRATFSRCDRLLMLIEFWPYGLKENQVDPVDLLTWLVDSGFRLTQLGTDIQLETRDDFEALTDSLQGKKHVDLVAKK